MSSAHAQALESGLGYGGADVTPIDPIVNSSQWGEGDSAAKVGTVAGNIDDILKPNGQFVGVVTGGATENIRRVPSSEFDNIKNGLLDGAIPSGTYANGKGTWYALPGGGRVGVRTSDSAGVTLDIDIPGFPSNLKIHQK